MRTLSVCAQLVLHNAKDTSNACTCYSNLQIAMQAELDASMAQQGILPIIHPEAFYSNAADVPDRPVVFAGLQFKVPSSSVGNLPLFTRDPAAGSTSYDGTILETV